MALGLHPRWLSRLKSVLDPIVRLVPADDDNEMLHCWKFPVIVPGPLIVAVVDAEVVEEKVIEPELLVHD